MCSAHADAVRPFWGRAFLLLSSTGLGAWLLVALLAFTGLQLVGYDLSYRQVAWPPAWREFREIQSRFYLQKAREAHAAKRPGDSLLALRQAYDLNPRDHSTGLLLAQLSQAGQPALSDDIYRRLYNARPDLRETTAQAWYRALLARGDFATMQNLAADRLASGETAALPPAWLQALLFVTRYSGETAKLAELAASPSLSPAQRALFTLSSTLPSLPAPERVRALASSVELERDPVVLAQLLRALLHENRPNLVVSLLETHALPLDDREKTRLRLDALSLASRHEEHSALLREVLALPTNPAVVELLSAHLIARPNLAALRACAEKFRLDPLPAEETSYPRLLAWFAACGANGDAELLRAAANSIRTVVARDSVALEIAQQTLLSGPDLRLDALLPLIQPLPLEVAYALYERFAPPPPFPL